MSNTAEPCCRVCGAGPDHLHSIERAISWRYVNWERRAGHWDRGDEWGDDVGDEAAESIGAACGRCSTEVEDPDELITTRRQYNRAHPVRRWWVERIRLVTPAKYEPSRTIAEENGTTYYAQGAKLADAVNEYDRIEVRARNPHDAAELASESGMVDGRYPWQARHGVPPELIEA
jgi:hypothetical protein